MGNPTELQSESDRQSLPPNRFGQPPQVARKSMDKSLIMDASDSGHTTIGGSKSISGDVIDGFAKQK
jgi:hypothetical protein